MLIAVIFCCFFSSFMLTPQEYLGQMTLREKAAQIVNAECNDLEPGDVRDYALGSVQSGGDGKPPTNQPEAWVEMVNRFMSESLESRLKIPMIYGIDSVHGNNGAYGATIFPHNINYGAIAVGDINLAIRAAEAEGRVVREETRAIGISWVFSPVLGNPQDIRWGRTYEGYSENIDIPTQLGPAFIRGAQSGGDIAACMKHYIGEGFATDGENQGNAILTDDQVRGILEPYRQAVSVGAQTVMASYNSINGLKCSENKFIMQTLMKDELGFEGFIASDWASVEQCSGATYKEQLAHSINAGMDMIFATGSGRSRWIETIDLIVENVQEGNINLTRLDDAALRILRVKQNINLLNNPDLTQVAGELGTPEHRNIAREHVAQSLVLLKNKNLILERLPRLTNILVAGQGADDVGMQCGGWTLTWQGGHGKTVPGTTILDGLRSLTGKNITYSADGTQTGTFEAAIVVIGENPYAEMCGDRNNSVPAAPVTVQNCGEPDPSLLAGIPYRKEDQAVLDNVYKLGIPTVVVILSGRPLTIGDEAEKWDGLIAAFLPGSETGLGFTDVVFGDGDFLAKLPYTWRKTVNGDILYPYGHGLSKRTEE